MTSKKSSTPPALGFFGTLKASFYSPEFYASIEQRPKGKAFGYFAILTAVYTLLLGASLLMVKSNLNITPESVGESIADIYPEDLVVTIKDGQVSINKEQPYFIEWPEAWKSYTKDLELNHLMVIDTETEFRVPQFRDYSALAWLTGDSFYYVEKNNFSAFPLDKVTTAEITKATADEFAQKLVIMLKRLLPTLGVVLMVGGFFALLCWHALYLLLLAVFISIIRSICKLPAGFGLSYKTGLYAMTYTYTTLAIMLAINVLTPWQVNSFPLMVTFITLAGVGLSLRHLKS